MTLSELWSRTWPLLLILSVAIGGWFWLSYLARVSRVAEDPEAVAKTIVTDFGQAKTWATDLLGLAGAFAGFLGIAAASQRLTGFNTADRARSAEGGMIGVLAGATLLGVGDWPVPAALALLVAGTSGVRIVRALKD